MDKEQYKNRRIDFVPPLAVKLKLEKYSKGNKTAFITDAINEKVARIEADSRAANSVARNLG